VRQVKEAYAIALAMSAGPFDESSYVSRLAAERARVVSLPDSRLDLEVTDDLRLRRISEGTWTLRPVELSNCAVWPEMGNRKWAMGLVPTMATQLQKPDHRDDIIWTIARTTARITHSVLPLIVIRRKSSPEHFRIDDGCHRAVAYWLVGYREAMAYVGTVPEQLNHKWPWQETRLPRRAP